MIYFSGSDGEVKCTSSKVRIDFRDLITTFTSSDSFAFSLFDEIENIQIISSIGMLQIQTTSLRFKINRLLRMQIF